MGIPQYGNLPQQYGNTPAFVPYLNLLQGVRMDYPNTWTVQEQSLPVSFNVMFGSPQQGPQDPFRENLTVTVQPVFAGTTQDSFIQGWNTLANQMGVQVLEASAVPFAGQNAYRVLLNTPPQPPAGQPNRILLYLFLIGSKGYTVMYTGQGADFDLFMPTVQQMLSTLQVH